MNPIIKLSDNAANRIKEIMSGAEKDALGVRVSVKSGGCAGMSYVMEYSKKSIQMMKLLRIRVLKFL